MDDLKIVSLSVGLRYMPLKAAFVTAKGRTETARALVVELGLSDGGTAYGSCSPAEYVTGENYDTAEASIRGMETAVDGASASDYQALFARLADQFPLAHAARAGVEIAIMDAAGRQAGQPLWKLFGGAQTEVATDLTVPLNSLEEAETVARQAGVDGIAHLKIKIDGAYPAEMLKRIRLVRDAHPDAMILIDANQSFTADGALAFLDILEREQIPVQLFEQPVDARDHSGLVRVAANAPLPVGADEAVVTPQDCRDLLAAGGVQVVNIKLMKSGISGALSIIEMCRAANVTLMLGCMLESHIGIGAAVHLACGTGAFTFLDLDAPLLLASDIAEGSFALAGHIMTPGNAPGLGARLTG